MKTRFRTIRSSLIALSVMTLAASGSVLAEEPETKTEGPKAEHTYEGAPSGVDPSMTKDMMDGEGPAITKAEFDSSKKIFFERCAGCHGVLRKGATGKPLTPDITRTKGSDYLKVFIITK